MWEESAKMGWNGGQRSQYCPRCKEPVSVSFGNTTAKCSLCGEIGCMSCMKRKFVGGRPTCHFVHFDECDNILPQSISLDSFCRLVDELIGSLNSVRNIDRLIRMLKARNWEWFDLKRGNEEYSHIWLAFESETNSFRLQLINPTGTNGGCNYISLFDYEKKRNMKPSEAVVKIVHLAERRLSAVGKMKAS
jgi:hypothetical protein